MKTARWFRCVRSKADRALGQHERDHGDRHVVSGGDRHDPRDGRTATLFINDTQDGSGRIGRTPFAVFSADETANIGIDRETPVSSDDTEETSRFTGTIDKVTIMRK